MRIQNISQSRNKGRDPLVLEIWLKATNHFSNTKDQLQEYVGCICVEIKEWKKKVASTDFILGEGRVGEVERGLTVSRVTCYVKKGWWLLQQPSLRSRRLEVVGERENWRARGRHARVFFSWALYFQAPATQASSNLTCDQALFFNKKGRRSAWSQVSSNRVPQSCVEWTKLHFGRFRIMRNVLAPLPWISTLQFCPAGQLHSLLQHYPKTCQRNSSETKIFGSPLTVETVILCTLMDETQIVEGLT